MRGANGRRGGSSGSGAGGLRALIGQNASTISPARVDFAHAPLAHPHIAMRMSRTAQTPRPPHTCQYTGLDAPCAACLADPARPKVDAATQATLRTALERSRNYRAQEAIESVKLPFHQPGADGYGPNGEQRFKTRKAYVEAGRRNSMEWQ